MPAEPQHSSHSRGSTSVRPGMPRSRLRGAVPDALGVGEVAGVVVGDGQLDRMARRLRGHRVEQLVHVAHLGRERRRPLLPLWIVGEQVAVVLHRRAAAGDVDGDRVVALVRGDGLPRRRQRGRFEPAVQLQRAAAARAGRGVHLPALGGEHPHGRGVDVAEQHPLDAALHERDPAALRVVPGRAAASRSPAAGWWRRARRAGPARASQRSRVAPRSRAGSRAARRRSRDEAASAGTIARSRPGWVNSAKIAARCSRSRRDAQRAALDLRAHLLDQLVVLHAGRAGGHAGHAAQAAVEVGPPSRQRERRARLVARSASARCGRAASRPLLRTRCSSGRSVRQNPQWTQSLMRSGSGGRVASQAVISDASHERAGPHRPRRVEPGLDPFHHAPAAPARAPATGPPTRAAPSSTAHGRGASAARTAATRSARSSPAARPATTGPARPGRPAWPARRGPRRPPRAGRSGGRRPSRPPRRAVRWAARWAAQQHLVVVDHARSPRRRRARRPRAPAHAR